MSDVTASPSVDLRESLGSMVKSLSRDEGLWREKRYRASERAARLRQELAAAEEELAEADRHMVDTQRFLVQVWDHYREVTGERPPA